MSSDIWMSFDPGERTGIAIWEGGFLINTLVASPENAAVERIAFGAKRLVFEMPRVRPHGKADPNKLLVLAYHAGQVVGAFKGAVIKYAPEDWGGQLPKATKNRQVREVMKIRQPDFELPTDHNALDAVGIGLHYLGLFPKKVHNRG